jgi:hypothetical protein
VLAHKPAGPGWIEEGMAQGRGAIVEANVAAPSWTVVQWVTFYVGWSNLIGGLLGFIGPLVFGSGDHMVNIHTGKLLGITSINGPHALLHAAMGLWGILAARASHRAALANIVATVLLWGALTVSYLLLADKDAPQLFILGMPVDNGATVVHLIWAGLALILLAQPLFRRGGKVVLPDDG